jgi:hypothetical protein
MTRRGLCCLALLLVVAGTASAGPPSDAWEQVHIRIVTFNYRTHGGHVREAYLVLPDWYGPRNNPPLPLVISPHGRGVRAAVNVDHWGDLPGLGRFAVVNPDGHGRRFGRFSWGYEGQVADLARMPQILKRKVPWLRINRRRIYAFGSSMGGQETLLLVARHPSLLAGAAAFDPVTDMARRYRDFARLRCNRACYRQWGFSLGRGLRSMARVEIGGTPAKRPRLYARRSPITYARAIARSGVPLQLWWSTRDRVVNPRDQSIPFVRKLRRLRPSASVYTVAGRWMHSAGMHPYSGLVTALRRFGLMPVTRQPASASAAPLHPLLPWHPAVRDSDGKLLAWYRPNANLGYDKVLRVGWNFVERRIPVDPRTGRKVFLHWAVFDGGSLRGIYWQHNPAFLNASFVDSLIAWFPYSGDRRAIAAVRELLDYQLAYGTTPRGWAWAHVPFPTACAGERTYGRCLAGFPRRFYGGIEPDKVGLLGRGYLQFYELTGERRYLRAALDAANALARHVRTGDATHTPWPFRVSARTGKVIGGAQFGGLVVGPVRLFDELLELRLGDSARYERARRLALSWLFEHQLETNRWSGFYEDVPYNPRSINQALPTLTALYLLERGEAADPQWQDHVRGLLNWVRSTFGRGPFAGAWGIDEQWAPGKPGCCSRVGLGSTTSRWAAAYAQLYARTGDTRAAETAVRSLNYSTYFARADGRVSCCGQRSTNTYWYSDGYSDYLRSFNWAMAAMPELAPKGQNHLLGSSSVVQAVSYGKRRVSYRTFSPQASEVLRLTFRPTRVEGADDDTVTPLGRDFVVRVRHEHSRRIRVSG